MGISSKYYFSDFTLDNYKRILSIASRNYSFRFFNEEFIDKSIILRHDLEFSIPTALKMAQIEAEFGIKATYFVQLHSEFYNTLERASIISIKEISNLGHQIGLHFDTHFWNIKTERQLDKHLLIDKNIIEKYTGFKIKDANTKQCGGYGEPKGDGSHFFMQFHRPLKRPFFYTFSCKIAAKVGRYTAKCP